MRILVAASACILITPPTLAEPAPTSADKSAQVFETTEDYPAKSLKQGEQGTAHYMLSIDEQGRAVKCQITRSSGFERLDHQTCLIALRRLRFNPARDDNGKPVASTYSSRVIWEIPGQVKYPPPCIATVANPGGCALN